MTYFDPPTKIITKDSKDGQIVKNYYIKSVGKYMTLYTSVMTYECVEVSLKSFRAGFPEYGHSREKLIVKN